jgi:hypothetical protein
VLISNTQLVLGQGKTTAHRRAAGSVSPQPRYQAPNAAPSNEQALIATVRDAGSDAWLLQLESKWRVADKAAVPVACSNQRSDKSIPDGVHTLRDVTGSSLSDTQLSEVLHAFKGDVLVRPQTCHCLTAARCCV